MNNITAEELLAIIENTGSRSTATLRRNGIANAYALARANPNLFEIHEGCSSIVISLNRKPYCSAKQMVAAAIVATVIIFIFILITVISNKNV